MNCRENREKSNIPIHKAYFIQTLQIKPSFNTRLEKLLTAFEQGRFVGDDKTTKLFPFEADDGEMKELLRVLQYVAADEKAREELDRENYYQDAMEGMFGEKNREIAEKKRIIEEQTVALSQQAEILSEQARQIEELKRLVESVKNKHFTQSLK